MPPTSAGIRPGPRNLVTDVEGILVGNAEDEAVRTGVTVVLPSRAALAAVDVRGGAPGTRETECLRPTSLVERIDAICLAGGSAFGLDAAGGVVQWLASQGRGFPIGEFRVPIVPAAILFDLGNGGDKNWGDEPPYRVLGRKAAAAAATDFRLGNAGAGYGAAAGRLKGGLGSASAVAADGLAVGAVIAVNCVGAATMPGSARLWAADYAQGDELGRQPPPPAGPLSLEIPLESRLGGHTVIGVVATNARLDKAEAQRIAMMAHDGLARAVRPVHTPLDGDTIFVLSAGDHRPPEARPLALARLGSLAADCVARAVARAVYEAESLGALPGYRTLFAGALSGGAT
jgi:L-aminopeptidase/D-esterase-like protein